MKQLFLYPMFTNISANVILLLTYITFKDPQLTFRIKYC